MKLTHAHTILSALALTLLTQCGERELSPTEKLSQETFMKAFASFASFTEAADEAGISRLYGGIHFRSAIELGLEQGRCIGAYAAALKTRK